MYVIRPDVTVADMKRLGFSVTSAKATKSSSHVIMSRRSEYDGFRDAYVDMAGSRAVLCRKETCLMGDPRPVISWSGYVGFFSRIVIKDLIKAGIAVRCRKKDIRE